MNPTFIDGLDELYTMQICGETFAKRKNSATKLNKIICIVTIYIAINSSHM